MLKEWNKDDVELPPSGKRVSNTWVTCLLVGDTSWKRLLIPNVLYGVKDLSGSARRWACGALDSWWGKSLPSQRCIAELRG